MIDIQTFCLETKNYRPAPLLHECLAELTPETFNKMPSDDALDVSRRMTLFK